MERKEPKLEGEVEELTRRETRQAITGSVNQIIESQFAKLKTFSGSKVQGKEEVRFEHWFFKVKIIEPHYKELVEQEAILQSVKGPAANIVQFLGSNVKVKTILWNWRQCTAL